MSVQAIAFAFAAQGLSPTEKLVLLALANYADENMRCWPSQRRLAHDTGLSKRTILRSLAALEERALLVRSKRDRDDGSRASDVVHLLFGGGDMVSPGGDTVSGGVVTQCQGGGDRVSPHEPSIEPSVGTSLSLRSRDARATDDGFERFWQAYPRKVGKLAARKAYAVAVRKVAGPDPPGLLIEAVERAKPFWTDPRFIPHPATWLNQGRWDDEPEPARTPRQANLDRAFRAAQSLLGERGP